MGATVSMTTYGDLLKRWYIDQKNLHRMDDGKNALLMAIDKDPTGTGDSWTVGVQVSNIVGGGAEYAVARANASAGVDKKFLGAWKERYDLGFIDQKVISTSQSPKGAIAPALKSKIDSVRRQNQRITNFQLYRDQGGSIGQIGAGFTSATGTLATNSQTVLQYVTKDMVLHFGPNKDGSSLRAGGVTVAGKSDSNGTFRTVAPTALSTQVTSIAENDYVFIAGTSGSNAQALAGLETWIPPTEALAATTFAGCDRSIDTRALAGNRCAASGLSIEESFVDGVSLAQQYDGNPKFVFTHSLRYAQLAKELGDRQRFEKGAARSFAGKGKVDTRFSFGGLALDSADGTVIVVKDPACQYGYSWVIDPDTVCLKSVGTWPFVRNLDGVNMLRQTDTSYVSELFAYGEMLCYAPGKNAIIVH